MGRILDIRTQWSSRKWLLLFIYLKLRKYEYNINMYSEYSVNSNSTYFIFKSKRMKVKDLPSKTNMGSVIVKTPEGKIGYWKSQWDKGVWLNNGKDGRVHPIFVDSLQDTLEWEVIEDETLINI